MNKRLLILGITALLICVSLSGCIGQQIATEKENDNSIILENQKPVIEECKFEYFDKETSPIVYFSGFAQDYDGEIKSYYWIVTDGTTSNRQSFTHVFEEIGIYYATLTVTDDDGETDSKTLEVTIYESSKEEANEEPYAVIGSWSTSYSENCEVWSFYDSSYDSDGYIVAWLWDFGDGSTSTEQNPTHTYTSNGKYSVTLTVWDDDEAADEAILILSVSIPAENIEPVAILSAEPTGGQAPLTVAFSAENSYDPDGHITSYKWLYEDVVISGGNGWGQQMRGTFINYDETFSNTYNYTGSFEVELIVYDNRGAVSNSATITIEVT